MSNPTGNQHIFADFENHAAKMDIDLEVTANKVIVNYAFWEIVNSSETNHEDKKMKTNTMSITLDLDELQSRRDWSTGNIYNLLFDKESHAYMGIINGPAFSFGLRSEVKENPLRFLPADAPIQIVVPHEDATFLDMRFRVSHIRESEFNSNIEFEHLDETPLSLYSGLIPELVIDGPDTLDKEAIGMYTISAMHNGELFTLPVDIEMKIDCGYLPKTKFTLVGTQQFKVSPLWLDTGDKITVSAGFKFFSSRVRKVIAIS